MKISTLNIKSLLVPCSAIIVVVLASCAAPITVPDGAVLARAKLLQLQSNSELASKAPIEIQTAEQAVIAAEIPRRDTALSQHLVMMATNKVDIATAWAQSRLYEDQREDLENESERVRLEARTREAELARRDAENARDAASSSRAQTQLAENVAQAARIDAENSRRQAAIANQESDTAQSEATLAREQSQVLRQETDTARNEATVAREQTQVLRQESEAARLANEDLQQQIRELNAVATDRGLVVVLGDVLFETGKAELRAGTINNLDKLAKFLNSYQDRTVQIEGHTDDVGSDQSNMILSRNRADAVSSYLITKGVQASRLTTTGKGETSPVTDNLTPAGRQQNRRVEVIISNPAVSSR